ncbi:pyridoxal-phosphate dependent enzyme [Sporosalibacterium faouarense]|uniref:pyridoxal-phosphate dependent enzyme n=1 Tax=Sporosalibacterium faouarense TaxID=516123 RepID=UPI00141CC579|nr:pyridoxal-phosphate dependent enzyme [Sporosalibacterium faouarense]MTI49298.1 pyridoxal-phosphate dependent enzyme [Bacillota bacterium]
MNKNMIKNRVGKTPLLRAYNLEKELGISKIYLKLEGNNPSGHRVDRLAYLLIKDAISVDKRTICLGTYGILGKSIAYLSDYYDVNCTIVVPKNSDLKNDEIIKSSRVEVIERGETINECLHYSQKLCEENNWYNANPGMENNIINMTALSFIAKELDSQIGEEINSVFSLMSYGFSVSGLDLGFRQLWINEKIKRLPMLYCCTINKGNTIYESYKKNSSKILPIPKEKVKVNKYNRDLIIYESSIAQDALDAIYDTNGKVTGISEEELISYINKFRELENVDLDIANGYPIAGFMKEVEKGNISDGNHVILLNDGRIDLDIRKVTKDDTDLSVDKIVEMVDNWLMDYTDPTYEIKDALHNAFDEGFVIFAYHNTELAGISIIVNTGFEEFIPTYHLAYIATSKKAKGRGIGTELLSTAIDLTDGNLSLHVERDNDRAIKLYEKMGFEKSYFRMIHKGRH